MTEASTGIVDELYQAIDSQTAKVGVVGLGYVGLPLIDAYISAGFSAIGFDVDSKKTVALNNGDSYIAHISPSTIQNWLDQDKFEATTDMDRLGEADVILICVPTPLSDSRDPDLKYVEMTAEEAHRYGLIGHVTRDGEALDKAMEIANRIARNGPVAVQAILRALRETECLPEKEALPIEAKIGMRVFMSDDAKEGPRAFAEKRKPEFKGR